MTTLPLGEVKTHLSELVTVSRLAASDAELARGEEVSAGELAAAMRNRTTRGD
jgi:hypothetical protein